MSGPITKGALVGALVHKFGFEPYRRKTRAGHEAYTLLIGGRKVATTRFSRQSNPYNIGKPLLRRMATQLRLGSLDVLFGMVACSVSQEEYLAKLRAGGYLD